MIATLKHKIESVPFELNTNLKTVTTYAWVSAGVLFAGYLYFVGAITFSVIKEQALQQNTKTLISTMSQEEVAYLNTQKSLTESYAISSAGLVTASAIAFAAQKSAFAWNVGH